jgi:hypothetical protein
MAGIPPAAAAQVRPVPHAVAPAPAQQACPDAPHGVHMAAAPLPVQARPVPQRAAAPPPAQQA